MILMRFALTCLRLDQENPELPQAPSKMLHHQTSSEADDGAKGFASVAELTGY